MEISLRAVLSPPRRVFEFVQWAGFAPGLGYLAVVWRGVRGVTVKALRKVGSRSVMA